MKKFILVLSLALFANLSYAAETIGEKAQAGTKDIKRGAKKVIHKAEDKFCEKGDAKCLKQKAEHKASEAKDAIKDKAEEGVNAVDNKK